MVRGGAGVQLFVRGSGGGEGGLMGRYGKGMIWGLLVRDFDESLIDVQEWDILENDRTRYIVQVVCFCIVCTSGETHSSPPPIYASPGIKAIVILHTWIGRFSYGLGRL